VFAFDVEEQYIDFRKRAEEYFFVPTLFRHINDELGGGVREGEVGYVLADSGKGKSTFFNCSLLKAGEYLRDKYPDKYAYLFLLEMDSKTRSEHILRAHYRETLGGLLSRGKAMVPRINAVIVDEEEFENSVLGVQRFLEKAERKPGVVYIDYLDNVDELIAADWKAYKREVKKLERLAKKFKCPVWTGSQASGINDDFDPEKDLLGGRNIAGAKNKKDSVALFLSLNPRADNVLVVNPFKCRRGSGAPFPAYYDFSRCLISDLEEGK